MRKLYLSQYKLIRHVSREHRRTILPSVLLNTIYFVPITVARLATNPSFFQRPALEIFKRSPCSENNKFNPQKTCLHGQEIEKPFWFGRKNPAMTMRSRRTLWYNPRCSLLPFRFHVVCLGQWENRLLHKKSSWRYVYSGRNRKSISVYRRKLAERLLSNPINF